jgi:hypothetical protein
MKIYHVTLTDEERLELEEMTRKGRRNAQVIRNALVLLNCDENNPSRQKKDTDLSTHSRTVG